MKIKIKSEHIYYDGSKLEAGQIVEVDEATAFKMIRVGYAEEIHDAKLKPKTKKAIQKSTKKNG